MPTGNKTEENGLSFLYINASARNIPWVFAYMTFRQQLFGQKITDEALKMAIVEKVPNARFDENNRLVKGPRFYQLSFRLTQHHINSRDEESILFVVDTGGVMDMEQRSYEGDGVVFQKRLEIRPEIFEDELTRTQTSRPERSARLLSIAAAARGE